MRHLQKKVWLRQNTATAYENPLRSQAARLQHLRQGVRRELESDQAQEEAYGRIAEHRWQTEFVLCLW